MTDMDPAAFKEYVAKHVERYLATDGQEGSSLSGKPCVIVTTKGARTGETRYSPVIRVPVPDSDDWIVVGSMGGQPKDPQWCHNIRAHPRDVTLQDMAVKRTYEATETSGDERRELWDVAVSIYPEYDEYQARCERTIPVFRLTPID